MNLIRTLILIFTMTWLAPLAYAGPQVIQVPTQKVCMITNMVFPSPQIPVKIGTKTYYGCCENCQHTLNNDPKSREAIDPVSGKKVDKALAVIGADTTGKVYYFQSLENLKKFKK